MKKYINALRYGSFRTKICLGLVIVLFIGAAAATLIAVTGHSFYAGVTAFMLFIFDLVFSQTISFSTTTINPKDKNGNGSEDGAEGGIFNIYTEKKIKKLLKSHHVDRDHKTVMIDRWKKEKIKQCPAYIWKQNGALQLLVLEKPDARKLSIPCEDIQYVLLVKDALVNEKEDYQGFQGHSLVSLVFSEYLPTYYEKNRGGDIKTYKNLYRIEPGVCFTNTSAKGLFEILGVDFKVEDEVTRSGKFDPYFIRVYQYSLLFKDQGIDTDEYKEKIMDTLKEMADSDMKDRLFIANLKQMMKYHLVSQEFANEAAAYGAKVRKERE